MQSSYSWAECYVLLGLLWHGGAQGPLSSVCGVGDPTWNLGKDPESLGKWQLAAEGASEQVHSSRGILCSLAPSVPAWGPWGG